MKRVLGMFIAAFCCMTALFASQDTLYITVDTIFVDSIAMPVAREKAVEYAVVTRMGNSKVRVKYFTLDGVATRVENYSVFNSYVRTRNGALLQFYPSGKIRRREVYKDNHCTSGEMWAEDGTQLPFTTPYFTPPVYAEEPASLMVKIDKWLKYPKDLLRRGISGKVLLKYTIGTDGRIGHVEVVESPHPEFSVSAKSAFKQIAKDVAVTPAKIEGTPMEYKAYMPVLFRPRTQ